MTVKLHMMVKQTYTIKKDKKKYEMNPLKDKEEEVGRNAKVCMISSK